MPKEAPDESRILIRERKKILLVPILHAPWADARNNAWALQQWSIWWISTLVLYAPVKGWGSHHYFNWSWIYYSTKVTSASCSIPRAFGVVGDVRTLHVGIGSSILLLQTIVWHIHVGGTDFFYIFIEALVDMKEEYIFLPWNLTK